MPGKDKTVSTLPAESQASKETVPAAGSEPPKPVPAFYRFLGLSPESGPEAEHEVAERKDLGCVIHRMLVAGLSATILILCTGLVLSAISHQPIPSRVSDYRQIFPDLKKGIPSGFFDLGILVLITTPVLRVVGSLIEFVNKRDWSYALITFLVLLILAASVMASRR